MRFLVCGVLLVGCASADPGFGPASPTRPDAPVAEAPSVAHALEDDPAPAPEEGPEDMHGKFSYVRETSRFYMRKTFAPGQKR